MNGASVSLYSDWLFLEQAKGRGGPLSKQEKVGAERTLLLLLDSPTKQVRLNSYAWRKLFPYLLAKKERGDIPETHINSHDTLG